MFRKGICASILFFALCSSAHALDETSSLPEPEQKVLSAIAQELRLNDASGVVRKKIHAVIEHVFKDGWYLYWVGNADLERSRFKDDKVRVVELIVPNNNRVNSVTLTYFPDAQQIFYMQRQFVEGGSTPIMDAFKTAKSNQDLKRFTEGENFAFFQRQGFVQFEIYHVKPSAGAIAYLHYGLIDLN